MLQKVRVGGAHEATADAAHVRGLCFSGKLNTCE